MINKENPTIRDEFAATIAGNLIGKSDIKVENDEFWLRKASRHNLKQLDAIAFLAYKLADKLIAERIRQD